jgi:hypothetical protein
MHGGSEAAKLTPHGNGGNRVRLRGVAQACGSDNYRRGGMGADVAVPARAVRHAVMTVKAVPDWSVPSGIDRGRGRFPVAAAVWNSALPTLLSDARANCLSVVLGGLA